MQKLYTFTSVLILYLVLTGCTQLASDPKATQEHPAVGAPTAIPQSTGLPPSGVPAEIVQETHLWTNATTGAVDLGKRPAGTPVTVFSFSGERVLIVEQHDPNKAAWVDVTDVAMGQDDWARLQLPRTETVLALCLPPATSMPVALGDKVIMGVQTYLGSFLEDGAPGLSLLVRTGFAADTVGLQVKILPVPVLELLDAPPKPPIWDKARFEQWLAIVRENQRRTDAHHQIIAAIRSQAESFIAGLQEQRLPTRASGADCVGQAGRELAQVQVPTRLIVVFTNLADRGPSSVTTSLQGIRLSLLSYCPDSPTACQATEAKWNSTLHQAGAQSVRSVEAAGPFINLAFAAVAPAIR